jgi:general L-amino acid transport system substrate-binding protein
MRKRLYAVMIVCVALGGCFQPRDEPAPAAAGGEEGDVLRTAAPKAESETLRKVRARGRLNCGVAGDAPGFATRTEDDGWQGFDVDFCRAVAAAVLGDAKAVNFTALDTRTRFAALQSGVVDLVARNTAWTFSRDSAQGVDFVGISYYGSQGLLAARSLDLANGLGGRRICVTGGSDQATLSDYFQTLQLPYTPVPADSEAEAVQFYQRGACDLLTGEQAALAAARQRLARPDDYEVLPQMAAKQPYGPMVREGDPGWTDVVQWTLHAMILADEFRLTSDNVDEAKRDATDPEVRRLLGVDGAYGPLLGLRKDWAYLVIERVGGYGEIFERNLGAGSPLKLPRRQNAVWNADPPGLLYAPPMR